MQQAPQHIDAACTFLAYAKTGRDRYCDCCCFFFFFFFCWLLTVPEVFLCISGTDVFKQLYVLPHWERSCRWTFLSHPVTVYRQRANQSKRLPFNTRHQQPLEYQFLTHRYDSTRTKDSRRKRDSNPAPETDASPLGQRGGQTLWIGERRCTSIATK